MQFRVRGNNVQIIKLAADESGKQKATVVGTFKRSSMDPSEELKAMLSKTEFKEVSDWIQFTNQTDALKLRVAALNLAEQMTLAVEWLKTADKSEVLFVTDPLLDAMRKLRKALSEKV